MELKDTIDLMLSDDFKQRMAAEYEQLEIRYYKLAKYVACGDGAGELEKEQLAIMSRYRRVLELRMLKAGIEVNVSGNVEVVDKPPAKPKGRPKKK